MLRRAFLQTIGGASAAAAIEAGKKPPNFVFILSDDLGYADIGCYGAKDIRTPAIDSLARDGVRFTDCYSNAPVCTPTRVGFLTGCYQQRFDPNLHWAMGPSNNKIAGLLPTESVLPGALRNAGYRCGMFGKWHVGWRPESRPGAHGFDEWMGILLGNADMYTHRYHDGSNDLWENDQPIEREGYLTEMLGERAAQFVEKNAENPFFLYLPFNAVHWPFQPPGRPQQIATSENWRDGTREDYVAMVESMDAAVGRLIDALRRKGLDDNTVVVFTNDNGGERLSDSGQFFHTKGTLFEGGIRVPGIVRWPGVAQAGHASSQVCATMDFTATFLAAAGVSPGSGRKLDGVDLKAVLRHPEATFARPLCWKIDQPGRRQLAIRDGRWKYIDDNSGNRNFPELLYNLDNDPSERRNLFRENQNLAAQLRKKALAWQEDVSKGAIPG